MGRIPAIEARESCSFYVVRRSFTVGDHRFGVGEKVSGDEARTWGAFSSLLGAGYLEIPTSAAAYELRRHLKVAAGVELPPGAVIDGSVLRSWPPLTFHSLLNMGWLVPSDAEPTWPHSTHGVRSTPQRLAGPTGRKR
ncbi:MAG: hypothetical protein JOZ81_20915 [Chloroflexi bacterium]|nr:hypothetical protein [Chloroflexota bacterium]